MPETQKLYLIDVSAYFYRAFFALPPLTTSTGLPTNAIYGFTTMLQKLLKDEAPDYLAAVMDRPEPTFRHEAYQDYKANREEMPDNLSQQIPYIKDVIQAFNIPMLEKPGFEADDIMGTLARQAEQDGVEVLIVSGDKDMCQMVSDKVKLLDTMKNKITDIAGVEKKFGVLPEKVIDVLGLMGDSSDNVPGVPGIGPKTAQSLVNEYGSMEEIYQNLEAITGKKVKQSLAENREQAFLSKKLVTIDTHVELDKSWQDLKLSPPDIDALRELFKKFEFTRLLKDVAAEKKTDKQYRWVTDWEEIRSLFDELRRQKSFTLDFETTSEFPMLAKIVGISFAWKDHEAIYIPMGHQGLPNQPDRDAVLAALKPILEDETIKKTGHNLKYEYIIFKRHGIHLRGMSCDTMVASYVLNPSKYRHSLDNVAMDYLDHKMISFKDVAGTGKKAVTFDKVEIEKASEYACEDSDITHILSKQLLPKIKEDGADELYDTIEMPLIEVLAGMEIRGVKLDLDFLQALSEEFGGKLEALEEKIYHEAGQAFNINSTKQLGEILFDKLLLPVQKKTKTGYSTDVSTLTELSRLHPLPGEILTFRSLAKLKSTYIDNMPALVNPETGRIHTSFNQTMTATGRLSSSDPNLQNIPIRTDEGRRIREAFITEPGWHLLSADYSQIELRLLAHLSEDETLIDAFLKDEDIHARTAAEVWNVEPDAVSADMRREAKVINFGIIYGMSSFGLSRELEISPKQAQEYIDSYFLQYGRVKGYMDQVLENARENEYVSTLMNRRRYLPDINARNNAVKKFAERTAVNAPIQGTAADLIKIAMINIDRDLERKKLQSKMILQVHDELVFEVPETEIEVMNTLVRTGMESVIELKVPLKVDMCWGKNWREAH